MGAYLLLIGGVLGGLGTPAFAAEGGPMRYLGRQHRDPTVNPLLARPVPAEEPTQVISEVVAPPYVSIQGIVWGGEAPAAIIEGGVRTKGDVLPDGVEILDISGSGIKVLYRGRIFTIFPEGAAEKR